MDKNKVEFYAEMKNETEAAYLFSDGVDEFWIPKSQVSEINHIKGNDYEVTIPVWLAADKGII
jgi:hypothetical protein